MDKELELKIKIFIAQELEKGTSLSDIQNLVNEKFAQRMTYMDIRILASSLDVDWRALDPNAKKESGDEAEPEHDEDQAVPEEKEEENAEAETACSTVVDVNPLARPGMMFSGSVKFASGSTAEWYVDSMGRLGLENLVGDKPGREDIEEFQKELDKVIRKMMGQ